MGETSVGGKFDFWADNKFRAYSWNGNAAIVVTLAPDQPFR
jgi:hypothetical protein